MYLRMTFAVLVIMVAVARLYGPQIAEKITADDLTSVDEFDPLRDSIDVVKGIVRKLGGG